MSSIFELVRKTPPRISKKCLKRMQLINALYDNVFRIFNLMALIFKMNAQQCAAQIRRTGLDNFLARPYTPDLPPTDYHSIEALRTSVTQH